MSRWVVRWSNENVWERRKSRNQERKRKQGWKVSPGKRRRMHYFRSIRHCGRLDHLSLNEEILAMQTVESTNPSLDPVFCLVVSRVTGSRNGFHPISTRAQPASHRSTAKFVSSRTLNYSMSQPPYLALVFVTHRPIHPLTKSDDGLHTCVRALLPTIYLLY